MNQSSTNELIALHLRYGQGAEPLRVRAYAQMVAKILYANTEKESTIHSISRDVSSALACKSVPRKQIAQALRFLAEQGQVIETKSNWSLTPLGHQSIESDLARAVTRTESVLQRHFTTLIDREILRPWFTEACLAFFQGFGDRWASAICGGVPLKTSVSTDFGELLRPSFRHHQLEPHADALSRSFRQFITSTFPEDAEQLWSVGQAMFAARLVAANISADPITLREIQGSTILLDTNVLLVAALEKHKLAEALSALGKAFNQLGIRLQFLNISRDEYVRIVDYNCRTVTRVVAKYGREVLDKSYNNFFSTALARGCTEPEHFETFFSTIVDPPSSIDDTQAITLLDFPELVEEVRKGSQDKKLTQKIGEAWLGARRREKKLRAIEHDAALIYAGRFLRSRGERCWVLTLDRTLHEYDLRHTHQKDYPLLLSFDVLIQILGLEEAGPGFDPTVFAPILSSIIAYQLSPALGTYTTEDLAWMLDLEERCADLPPTAVEDLAIEINRARLSGKDKDDPELRLQIQRGFQKRKLSLAGDLDSTRETLRHTDSQLTDALEKRKILEDAYRSTRTRELRGQATRRLIQSGSVNLLIGLVFALGAVYLTLSSVSFEQRATFWGLLLTAFSFAFIFFIRIFHTVVPSYRTELANIEGVVASEVVHMFEPNR